MATTSGTYNNQSIVWDVIRLQEQAIRRCGKLQGTLSAEDVVAAQQELQLGLNTMITDGVPLWTIQKYIYGLNLNQNQLQLAPEIIDVRNILYRFGSQYLPSGGAASSSAGGNAQNAFDQQLGTACTQTAPDGSIMYAFATPSVVCSVGLLPFVTGSLNPIYEYSNDAATWFTSVPAASAPSTFQANQWYYQDVAQPQSCLYFRIRETSGGTLNVQQLAFVLSPVREIEISRNNQDDYQNLPNKNFPGRVLEYWLDRQIVPRLWMWPASMYWLDSLVVWGRREIQDVGSPGATLEFPVRWLDYVVSDLAQRMSLVIPGVDPQRIPVLAAAAQAAKDRVWNEERDASPFYLAPEIGGYTGGGGYYGSR